MTAWGDLDIRGFLVVRDFLSAAELAGLDEDFERGAPPSSYAHGFKPIARATLDRLAPRLGPVLAAVRAHTSLAVDLVTPLTMSHYITTHAGGAERTSHWHQDFDLDYRLTGDHHNLLNFWLPFRKPEAGRTNLSVLPFDALAQASPASARLLTGSGGHRLVARAGQTRVHGHRGEVLYGDDPGIPAAILDLDIGELAETPALVAGDLLLLRGDVVHRTQDAETERRAASIRATWSGKTIKRERATGSEPIVAAIQSCFAAVGGPAEMTIASFLELARGARP